MFPAIHNSAYVLTSPYTTVQVPLTVSRPLAMPTTNLYFEPTSSSIFQTPTMMYTTLADSYINQKSILNCENKKDENHRECMKQHEPIHIATPAAYIHSTPHVVYTSIAGDLINQQSILNAERKVDDKINETVQAQIKKFELEKLKEDDFKKRLIEYESSKTCHECVHHHDDCCRDHHEDKHHHHHQQQQNKQTEHHHHCDTSSHVDKHNADKHTDHHHHHICERTQGSQTSFADMDKTCCCCSSNHKLPVCTGCVNSHSDFCLETKIRRIRQELNLPSAEKQEHDHREYVTPNAPKVEFSNTIYEVDTRKSRSRSKKRTGECKSKSRSPSLNSRPQWMPTGANDYSWTNQTRSQILNDQYRATSAVEVSNKKKHTEKGNQTTFSNDITLVYPTQTLHRYEYHEVPVKMTENSLNHHKNNSKLTRSRSTSKHRSCSPIWHNTNKNDYSWTTHTLDNYGNCINSSTKTTNVYHQSRTHEKPIAETFYTYETIRPKTSFDHLYEKKNHRVHQTTPKINDDYYYYESKPKVRFVEKSTSTLPNNAVGTQTVHQKPASASSLGMSRDCLNKFNVYIK